MKVFVDANILVSVLNHEYPLFTYTSRILSLAGSNRFRIFTSPSCLAIAFYFAEKKYKSASAKEKIGLLARHLSIADNTESGVLKTVNDSRIQDFEDGLQYYTAVEKNCDCIVTEDIGDYYYSSLEVLGSRAFFEKYMNQKGK